MSNDSVMVPLATLKRWEDEFGHRIPVDFLREVLDLIPAPPKVGDTITGRQFAALPPLSVAIDTDGDVWVVTNSSDATVVRSDGTYASHDDIVTEEDVYGAIDLHQGTLVHIGEEVI